MSQAIHHTVTILSHPHLGQLNQDSEVLYTVRYSDAGRIQLLKSDDKYFVFKNTGHDYRKYVSEKNLITRSNAKITKAQATELWNQRKIDMVLVSDTSDDEPKTTGDQDANEPADSPDKRETNVNVFVSPSPQKTRSNKKSLSEDDFRF